MHQSCRRTLWLSSGGYFSTRKGVVKIAIVDALANREIEKLAESLELILHHSLEVTKSIRKHDTVRKERMSRRLFSKMLLGIYEYDYSSLKRDLAKVAVVDGEGCRADSGERVKLLRVLFDELLQQCDDDLSFLLAECDRVMAEHEEADGSKLPFT